jgi:uncharacterized damage-inducible protein DinB
MNMLDRLLGHDLATTRELLQRCFELTDEQLDRDFDAGWRTLRKTCDHMIGNIETWTDLMMERPVRPASDRIAVQDFLERLEHSYAEFAAFATQIEDEGRLDDLWTDVLDNPPVQKSFGGAIGHVITHNMHHRAELLHMMHRLGMKNLPEGDLMGWDQRTRLSPGER